MRAFPAGASVLLVFCALAFGGLAHAQYEGTAKVEAAPEAGGLPPFLAKMERHDVDVRVGHLRADGTEGPAPAGLNVGIRILAGGAKVRDYTEPTNAAGVAEFKGIPSNPEVQGSIRYQIWVDHEGVRFPFALEGVPNDANDIEVSITDVTTDLGDLLLEHTFIELFPDEESLVARHQMKLHNLGKLAVNLSAMPGGGLKLPTPTGAKHPSLHDEHDPQLEVRGTDIIFKGALLPVGSEPATINSVYSLPYDDEVFRWSQAMPVPSTVGTIVAPRGLQEGHRVPIDLGLRAGKIGAVEDSELPGGKSFTVLRGEGAQLAANDPLEFAITGVPAQGLSRFAGLIFGLIAVVFAVLFGFRKKEGTAPRLSRAHLVAERDRLVRALARMRRAAEKGKISEARFEREREAITARLVSLYRALERVDAR